MTSSGPSATSQAQSLRPPSCPIELLLPLLGPVLHRVECVCSEWAAEAAGLVQVWLRELVVLPELHHQLCMEHFANPHLPPSADQQLATASTIALHHRPSGSVLRVCGKIRDSELAFAFGGSQGTARIQKSESCERGRLECIGGRLYAVWKETRVQRLEEETWRMEDGNWVGGTAWGPFKPWQPDRFPFERWRQVSVDGCGLFWVDRMKCRAEVEAGLDVLLV